MMDPERFERETIGLDARISLADFTGEFVDLADWQRELVETIAAIPADQRDKVLIIDGPGQRVRGWDLAGNSNNMGEAIILGMDFDRILIDDPIAEAKSREAQIYELAHQFEVKRCISEERPRPLKENRADRRAQAARDRKAGR